MGSGHILVYAFDLLMSIYTQQGWSERDAAVSIITKNLYGLDIDRRAYQLAYFSLMMKARQYNRRLLSLSAEGACTPNIANFQDIGRFSTDMLTGEIAQLAGQFENCDTYGSLIDVQEIQGLDEAIDEFHGVIGFNGEQLERMMQLYKILSQQYDVVCTNPPYMGGSGMNSTLSNFVKEKFADYKSDLFSAFMVKIFDWCKPNGQIGLVTPYVWMFIQSYEKLRQLVYASTSITSMIQLEYNAFESACVPVATFTFCKSEIKTSGEYIKLSDFKGIENQEPKTLEAINNPKCGYRYTAKQENFSKIPGMPVAYWVSQTVFDNFEKGKSLGSFAYPRQGLASADNNRFLKLWHEVSIDRIDFGKTDNDTPTFKKWYPHNKGGEFRKWYGNRFYVINWEYDGSELKNFKGSVIRNPDLYFKESVSYSDLTSGSYSLRYYGTGFTFDSTGPSIFNSGTYVSTNYLLGVMNSNVINTSFLKILCPTLHYTQSAVAKVPIILADDKDIVFTVERLAEESIHISKEDWDSFETSWDFERHPLV